jgi:hypothetical protein
MDRRWIAAVNAAESAVRSSANRSAYPRETSLSGGHHMQHGGFDPIEALAHLRKTVTAFPAEASRFRVPDFP